MKILASAMTFILPSLLGSWPALAEENPIGEQTYNRWCIHCHAAGESDYPGTWKLALRLGKEEAVLTDRKNLVPVYVRHIVRNGIGAMPAFRGTEITDEELEELAKYLDKATQK